MLDLSMPITRSIVKSQIELTNFPFRIAVYETICFPIKNINTFLDDNILALLKIMEQIESISLLQS